MKEKEGVMVSVSVLRTVLKMLSGLGALWGLRFWSSLAMPGAVTVMGLILVGGGGVGLAGFCWCP